MKDERLVVCNGKQLGQIRLLRPDVDEGVAAVPKDPEAAIEMEIHGGRLKVGRVVRSDPNTIGGQRRGYVPVRQNAHLAVAPLSRCEYRLSTSRFRVSRSSKLW